ncbi:MAG: ABC transporter permease subunit [Propionibacteriales bacterium]|nr:ABC transporter permease subunit [Propionibacteriales bacterium]
MLGYVGRRLRSFVAVLFVISLISFVLTRVLFPSPVQQILGGQSSSATSAQLARLENELGLDEPLAVQYVEWLGSVLTGDLGRSFLQPVPVSTAILQRLPATFEISVLAIAFAIVCGLVLGVAGALRRGGVVDALTSTTSVVALSVPNFFLGILLILLFALQLGLLPTGGYVPFSQDPLGNLRSMVLPVLTLSAAYVGYFARFSRSLMITVLGEDYILRAHASGIKPRAVIWRHGLRNTLLPLLTVVGVNVAGLVGGAVVTETIFSIPGVGTLLVSSILSKDFPVLQGLVLVITVCVLTINLVIDLLYGLIDPRVRVT